eukprot:366890-Hanusia_phi.AAC.2
MCTETTQQECDGGGRGAGGSLLQLQCLSVSAVSSYCCGPEVLGQFAAAAFFCPVLLGLAAPLCARVVRFPPAQSRLSEDEKAKTRSLLPQGNSFPLVDL